MERVSWDDCRGFVDALNRLGLGRFSLPSEMQWEHACRAGTSAAFFWGENEADADTYAWYRDNAGNQTHEVGTRKPNPWGLYDMAGNVAEWCDYPSTSSGGDRIVRGGAWNSPGEYLSWTGHPPSC